MSGCWLWTGYVSQRKPRGGYGKFVPGHGYKSSQAHRFAYEYFVGPIPEGLELDHLCRVRCCVNPKHLEAVTGSVNVKRGESPNQLRALIVSKLLTTHCRKGHEFNSENTYISVKGKRTCRVCARPVYQRYNQRRKLARLQSPTA